MSVLQVKEWLKRIPDDADIAVDDGGLVLVTRMSGEGGEWGRDVLELGGIPLPKDELSDELEDDDHLIVDHEDDNDRRVKKMVIDRFSSRTKDELSSAT